MNPIGDLVLLAVTFQAPPLWAIADDIVDGYFPFADELGDAVDGIQDRVIEKATPDTLEELFLLKRELIEVRRAASPTREVFNQLTNRELPLIDADPFFIISTTFGRPSFTLKTTLHFTPAA